MPLFDPKFLQVESKGQWNGPAVFRPINGFSIDTRTLKEGEMFVALKTTQRDGHDFLENAYAKGASAALVEEINTAIPVPQLLVQNSQEAFQRIAHAHRNRFNGNVIGITGSCGKTTTKDLLAQLLGVDKTLSTEKNLNNLLGVPLTLTKIDPEKHHYAVVEAGMNVPGEMEVLGKIIEPDLAIVSSVAPAHLFVLKTIENVAIEKAYLPKSLKKGGSLFCPQMCMEYRPFKPFWPSVTILKKEKEAPIQDVLGRCVDYEIDYEGDNSITLNMQFPDGEAHRFEAPFLSEGMLSNVTLAISVAQSLGVNFCDIQERLNSWEPVANRGQILDYGKQIYFADCYNANPQAVKDALQYFDRRFDETLNRLYVLGCMTELGESADDLHYEVGQTLKLRPQDKAVILGDQAHIYAKGVLSNTSNSAQVLCVRDHDEARTHLAGFEGAVFLKGANYYKMWELLPDAKQSKEKELVPC